MVEKRGAITLLAILFSLVIAQAANQPFTVSVTTLNNQIAVGDNAVFYINITNTQEDADVFQISGGDIAWSFLSDPLSDYFSGLTIAPGETNSLLLLVRPVRNMQLGQYKVELFIRSTLTGVVKKETLTVDLRSPRPEIREYLAAVRRLVDMPSQADPRQPMHIGVNLENRNPRNVSALSITLSSKLISKHAEIYLGPYERRVVSFTIDLDPRTKPQKDTLTVTLVADNRTLDPVITEEYEIIAYSDVKAQKLPVRNRFFLSEEETVYINNGNSMTVEHVELQTGLLSRLFTRTIPRSYTIDKDGTHSLAWDLGLESGASESIIIIHDYRILLLIALLGLAGAVVYYIFRSPVAIRKEGVVIGMNEGGISELKVLLHVKNRTDRPFDRLTVVDRIPNIVEITKDVEIGSLRPSKVFQHEREGTVIKWEIGAIEKYEERIITYKVKSKLTVLGNFVLPPALVKFNDPKGREYVSKSGSYEIEI